MTKKFFAWLWLWVILASTISPIVSANGDDFWDFSTNVWTTSTYETTQEDAQNAADSFIKKLDFFWASLLSNAILYWYYYPNCFTVKQEWKSEVIYAKPAFCWPKWAKLWENEKPIKINWKLKVQDLMDWKYSLASKTLLVWLPLWFAIWLLVYIFFYKYWSTWWQTEWSTWSWLWWWMSWMWMWMWWMSWMWWSWTTWWTNSITSWWTIWSWIIEKLFGKNDKKDWEEDKNDVATKIFAIIFILFLLWAGNALSLSLSSSIPIYFDWWFTWISSLYWIWLLYLFSYWIFLWMIFILIKFPLLKFIQIDVEKKENVSLPMETFKLFWIAVILLWLASLLVSNFWVQLFSIFLRA